MPKDKTTAIKDQLKKAGITSKTLLNLESKNLIDVLYEDEVIGGAIHGAYSGGLAWLIATDKRIIFMDKKPLFKTVDEISYDIVSGTKTTKTKFSETITLHTRLGDYTINFVKDNSAKIFNKFIEDKRLGRIEVPETIPDKTEKIQVSEECTNFLRLHNIGVLSTISREGSISGATVYYLVDKDNNIYILSKSDTNKARNILSSNQASFTIYDEKKLQTVQLNGTVEIETNQEIMNFVYDELSKPRSYEEGIKYPPVTKIHEGMFIIIKITPSKIKYLDFNLI